MATTEVTRPRRVPVMSPHEWQQHKDMLCHQCRHDAARGGCRIKWWIDKDPADVVTGRMFHGRTCSQYEARPAPEPRKGARRRA